MIEMKNVENEADAKILVVGVGGGGNNAVNRMVDGGTKGVTFAAVNTDAAVLCSSKAEYALKIGEKLLHGYGAGADPEKGEAAALESEEQIRELIRGYHMIIITSGMGGGTGTGAAPVIAKMCREEGILTLGIVTKPFSFESRPRILAAEAGIERLKSVVDTLLVIPNDKLFAISDRQLKLKDAFVLADSVLRYAIEGVTNIVYRLGEINIDFNDLRTTLLNKGIGHIGIGTVDAEGAIMDAVNQAVNSPLLDTSIVGAQNLLVNTSGDITLAALGEAVGHIRELAGPHVNIIWGTVSNENPEDSRIVVTIIATGMPENGDVASVGDVAGIGDDENCIMRGSAFAGGGAAARGSALPGGCAAARGSALPGGGTAARGSAVSKSVPDIALDVKRPQSIVVPNFLLNYTENDKSKRR